MEWFYGSSTLKSSTELQRLVDNVILAEDFSREELLSFHATKENERLDHWVDSGTALNSGVPFSTGTSWRETSIKILIPAEKVVFRNAESVPRAEVSGLFYRRPIEVIKAALSEPLAQDFHLTPYQAHWTPDQNKPPERLYSEIYTTDAFLNEHAKIKSQMPQGNCQLETVVLSLMFWSDSTHLTTFSDASLWPIYMFFGNLSKYTRGKPSAHASHHIAYIPKVSLSNAGMISFSSCDYSLAIPSRIVIKPFIKSIPLNPSSQTAVASLFMRFGSFSWMKILLRHTKMGSPMNFSMVSFVGCF